MTSWVIKLPPCEEDDDFAHNLTNNPSSLWVMIDDDFGRYNICFTPIKENALRFSREVDALKFKEFVSKAGLLIDYERFVVTEFDFSEESKYDAS